MARCRRRHRRRRAQIKTAIIQPVLTAEEAAEERQLEPSTPRDNEALAKRSGLPQLRAQLSAENVAALLGVPGHLSHKLRRRAAASAARRAAPVSRRASARSNACFF